MITAGGTTVSSPVYPRTKKEALGRLAGAARPDRMTLIAYGLRG